MRSRHTSRKEIAMIALKNVLVATDFGDCSQAAVEQARALAEVFGASMHLLHVVTEPLHEVWACYAPGADFLPLVEQLQADAMKRLALLASPYEVTVGRVVLAASWGDPGDEVLKYARAHDVDLIVCGTHGRRGWDRVVMGSVAERVVRTAPCPVLTVHAPANAGIAA
jgi:nucleotide-binding universal stress UspA family protein